jgi:hypothetical protein
MRLQLLLQALLIAATTVLLVGPAQAAVKSFDSSADNGTPGDFLGNSTNSCPPVTVREDFLQGSVELEDDGLGTVTMNAIAIVIDNLVNLGPENLVQVFGPGAFVFIETRQTESISAARVSNSTGVGAHGPSGTAPGETTEWGVVSNWQTTGQLFCVASPVAICNNGGFSHGATAAPELTSDTFDLGTWTFDSVGDYATDTPHIVRTSNGGLQNNRYDMRGAFMGASLPALPLVGFGALALSIALIGARVVLGRK